MVRKLQRLRKMDVFLINQTKFQLPNTKITRSRRRHGGLTAINCDSLQSFKTARGKRNTFLPLLRATRSFSFVYLNYFKNDKVVFSLPQAKLDNYPQFIRRRRN